MLSRKRMMPGDHKYIFLPRDRTQLDEGFIFYVRTESHIAAAFFYFSNNISGIPLVKMKVYILILRGVQKFLHQMRDKGRAQRIDESKVNRSLPWINELF